MRAATDAAAPPGPDESLVVRTYQLGPDGLIDTGVACAVGPGWYSCYPADADEAFDGGRVTWVAEPTGSHPLVATHGYGWYEVDGESLVPLDTVAVAHVEGPVPLGVASTWPQGMPSPPTILGVPWAVAAVMLALLTAVATVLLVARRVRRPARA
ncbi:hypothetical protein [Demequina mangrovi]|uniref:Uncharacterized protein n=1 Tax=Demequina mangrovi TaxID=1043493 RepID=A0A1H6YAS2_9MICO|nr:hypothetical protein [Demequina mangrovi]SEJ36127.1 hypothetical protein SAMN05421637_1562 [Demequina mangrovi]